MTTKFTRRDWLTTLAAVPAAAYGAAPPAASLFNGKDFTGWQRAAHGIWTVEDGAMVGRCDHSKPGPGYMLTRREYTDFRLSLEFYVSPRGNSGVYIREPQRAWGPGGNNRPAHGNPAGYEVQIDYNDPKNYTGALYNIQQSSRLVGAEDRWNRMEIECLGPAVQVWVEGELVNRYSPSRSPKGVIGFQIHGGKPHNHIVKFRNIRLAERA